MTETVLDSASVNGLLLMAGEEGLLRDRDDYGDKFLYSLKHHPLAEWHRQQILEQVILNSKVISARGIPFDWLEGDFLSLGLIKIPEHMLEWQDEGRAVSPEILEGLLRARGYNPDLSKWQTLFENASSILEEIETFERLHPGVEIGKLSTLIRVLFDKEFRQTDEYKLASRWNTAYNEVQPMLGVIEEFLQLSQYASENRCNLKIPLYRPSANLINLPISGAEEGELTKVFRITTQELGTLPVCRSLREALQLAKDPATLALRHQIEEWLGSLENTSVDVTRRIQDEIKKASQSLIKACKLKTAGFVTGIISIPVSAIGIVNPFAGAVGLGLTCLAVICERSSNKIENAVRWVGFGSRRFNS